MTRRLVMLGGACAAAALAGCAGTWDRVSSQSFRDAPFKNMFSSEDPMTVLRTKAVGGERAAAMRRLTEPAADGRPAAEQDEALQILGGEATASPSPVVRAAAIDALGRFQDPRAVNILIAAYHKADGLAADPHGGGGGDSVQQAAAFRRADPTDPLSMLGPTGFEPVFVSTLRAKAVKSLANTSSPEAVRFLANVATAPPATAKPDDKTDDAPDANTADRDVRSAAVRGLGRMRSQEAVVALARVLKDEAGRDVVLASNAHAGLKELTGKDLPADPDQWNKVIQAGVSVQPEPNAVQRAVGLVTK